MPLSEYMQRTYLLLNDLNFETVRDQDVIRFINMARGQIAGEFEAVRFMASLSVSAGTQAYAFSTISLAGSTGIQGILNVRQITYAAASGQLPITSKPFPWFNRYYIGQAAPVAGPPEIWSQFAQGSNGSLYVNLPDNAYTLSCDCSCYPINLALDGDAEALPYLFTDAIPFLAAYYAFLSKQQFDQADRMWQEYGKFGARAGRASTPKVASGNFAQAPDLVLQNRLGISPPGGQ